LVSFSNLLIKLFAMTYEHAAVNRGNDLVSAKTEESKISESAQ
jgi:hypothetical protein